MQRPGTVFAFLAAITLFTLWPVLGAPLVLDDPEVLQSAPASWGEFFRSLPDPVQRPLARATLALDRWVAPEAFDRRHWGAMGHSAPPGTYTELRLTGGAIHAANAFLVWLLVSRWFLPGCPAAALFAAALFAAHPVSVSTAGYIAQRGTLLSTSGCLAGCVAFLRAFGVGEGKVSAARGILGTGLCILAAVFSHGQGLAAVLLPAGLVCVGWAEAGRHARAGWILATAAGSALVAWWLWREAGSLAAAGRSVSGEIIAQCRALAGGLGKAALARPHPLDGAPAGFAWGAVAFVLAGVAWVLANATERRILMVGAAGVLAMLMPAALFPLKDPFFAHRLYPALAAFALIVSVAVSVLESRVRRGAWPALAAGFLFIAASGRAQAVSLSGHTHAWGDSCRSAPRSPRVRVNLGNAWALAGSPVRARAQYARTLVIDPDHRGAAENLKRLSD